METTKLLKTEKGIVNIRPATAGDAARVRELRLEALRSHPQAFSADYDSSANDPLETWAERLKKYTESSDQTLNLADAGAELVGMAGVYRDPRPKIRHAATIWGVYVKPGWRGLHLGNGLVQACLDWASGHEVIFVRLGVITINASAIRCYQRCGFTVYGVEPKSIYWEGHYYDELLMSCEVEVGNEDQ